MSLETSNSPPAPVIILGAARSGTKLLRSIIAAADEFQAVPHDVNFIWRHSLSQTEDDAISASSIKPRTKLFIRGQLRSMAGLEEKTRCGFVEKTVSNALRVPFVRSVVPNARFIHLIRDGYAVTESALRCWHAPPDYRRMISKMRDYPWLSCRDYALNYARGWITRYISEQKTLPSWGPRYTGIEHDLLTKSLIEVCALQWQHCVEQARTGLSAVPSHQWAEVRYEDLARDPAGIGRRIGDFLRVAKPEQVSEAARTQVRTLSPRSLSPRTEFEQEAVRQIVEPTMGSLFSNTKPNSMHPAA